MSATSLSERDGHDRPWGQSAPSINEGQSSALKAQVKHHLQKGRHLRSILSSSSFLCLMHGNSTGTPMLPKEGSQHACVGVWVCVGVQGGVKAKAEEGKINQILQEVWCDCHSHCHVFLQQQHRAQGRTQNWDLIQHWEANLSQKALSQRDGSCFHQTCLIKPKSSTSIGLWRTKTVPVFLFPFVLTQVTIPLRVLVMHWEASSCLSWATWSFTTHSYCRKQDLIRVSCRKGPQTLNQFCISSKGSMKEKSKAAGHYNYNRQNIALLKLGNIL